MAFLTLPIARNLTLKICFTFYENFDAQLIGFKGWCGIGGEMQSTISDISIISVIEISNQHTGILVVSCNGT